MVTSRATGDDLIEDQDTPSADITGSADVTDDIGTSDIMAPPRKPARKPAPARSDPAKDAGSDRKAGGRVSANGTPAAGKQDAPAGDAGATPAAQEAARPAPADATIVDGIPALPADTIGTSRGGKPAEDPLIAYPAEAAAKPAGEAPAPAPAASTTSAPWSSATTSSGPRSSDSGSSAPAPEPSSVPPAAFAWEMPDPPPHSPSSPARAFLRSGVTAKNPVPAKPSSAATASTASTASAPSVPSAPAGKPATGQAPARGPVTIGQSRGGPSKGGPGAGTGAKGQQKAQSKRSARQAHLTISRVEPWSVMKFSFVVSLVAFVILFVAVSVLYGALSGLGVFDSLQRVVSSVTSSQGSTGVNAKAWFSASRVLGYTALLGSLNIVLITAMSTIGSVVYNLTSRLVGGIEVTLKETE